MEKDEKQTEEVEVKEQTQQDNQQPDKPVEQSQFNKYRDAYDETDSNLDQVFDDLKVRMRLQERVKYVDPSPMNFARQYPAPVDLREVGHQMYKELKRKGRL